MNISELTGDDTYFEDFKVGQKMRHWRGKTVSEVENVMLSNLVMNSADSHFNEHKMQGRPLRHIVSYGGVNLSIVFGLATQDTTENALAELGMDKIRFTGFVHHGDTLYAATEVLEVGDAGRPDAGTVRFRHTGFNQHGKIVVQGERRVLIKRRSHWGKR